MSDRKSLAEHLRENGISRRGFMKFCAATASMMALPPAMVPAIALPYNSRSRGPPT